MGKTARFGGREGSFGRYGGSEVKYTSRFSRGYNQKVCCLCDDKAIYHVGGDGYCRGHKQVAVGRLAKYKNVLNTSLGERELDDIEYDRGDINKLRVKGYLSAGAIK